MLHYVASALRRTPLALRLLFAGLCLLPAHQAVAAEIPERQQAAALTEQLLQLQKRLDHAASAERPQLLQQLQQQAARRQSLLAELAERDPAAALRASLPERVQNSLAREVLAQVERPLQVEGTLEVNYEDYADGGHRLRHFLNTPFGERFELNFAKDAPRHGNGQQVRLDGVLFDQPTTDHNGVVALEDGDSSLVWLDNAGTSTTLDASVTPDVQYSLGEQKTLMLLVNFSDNTAQPWTPTQAKGMFDNLDAYIRENSAGRTWLTGSVAGWYTIALSSTVCDSYSLKLQAQTAAAQSGHTLSDYDRLIYVFPKNACGYVGSGSVGGKPTDTYINNQFDLHNLAHEFGHNLGLDHARALECGTSSLGSSCSSVVYGDTLDVLGKNNGSEGHYNPFNKERLGWLKNSEIVNVSSSGRFDLLPYADLAGSGARVLKVSKPDDPTNWYYVGFHQPVGFEAQLLDGSTVNVANVTNGVVVHRGGSNTYSELMDMTPNSASTSTSDWQDPALEQGHAFSDSGAGVTLSTTWVDAQKAQVDVQFSGSASCVQNAPSVQVGAPVTQWGSAGQTLTYQVQLTNNDSGACTGRSFNLQASQPSGWSNRFASASLSLAPGQTTSTSLSVTSAGNAAAAYYDISVNTSQAPASSATLTYVVEASTANSAPLAVDDQVSLASIAPATIAVLANDSDPEGASLSIATFTQGSKGTVKLNSDGTLTYSPAKGFKSTDQFSYTISDGQNTASATVYLSLQSTGSASTGGKGNR
ncbi:cadherin-like domain-containing protein [Pseudomonas sp. MAP12]|uniref:Cadherin-like domain-containing protein n=1 Tax=Geopseudomonas aromaticivorans TaxID=2849492 RepID=A0ABS6MS85_9GAMM|nr:Ig-like domain-containing protein [Pseudomonas aromaticivorans]MBV2131605.1 cadherin-like domain-containing protein [Pseudomonas aromaticivorans]